MVDVNVGRYYKTRDGEVAYITKEKPAGRHYNMTGSIISNSRRKIVTWDCTGSYFGGGIKSGLDIVEEIHITDHPEYYI